MVHSPDVSGEYFGGYLWMTEIVVGNGLAVGIRWNSLLGCGMWAWQCAKIAGGFFGGDHINRDVKGDVGACLYVIITYSRVGI